MFKVVAALIVHNVPIMLAVDIYKIHRHAARSNLFEIETAERFLSDRKLRVRASARVVFLRLKPERERGFKLK